MNDFTTYLKQHTYSDSTIETYTSIVHTFLKWCKQKGYDVECMTYKQCTNYFNALKRKKIKYDKYLSDTTIKSYTGAIKVYFDYLVNEDVYTVSPIEDYNYVIDKGYEHELLTAKELELLYICFPTLDIKLPNCKHVAIRNKVITGFMVFQGLDTSILKRLTLDHINLDKQKLYIPGTKTTEPKTFKLKPEQIPVLRQYLFEDRAMLQNKINNHSKTLFLLNSNRFSIITTQVMKVLKTINYKVINNHQIRASVIALWVQRDDLRTAQKKARHRYITSTENYKKYDPNANRSAADVFHLMR
jgi:integrase/recombinase XerD